MPYGIDTMKQIYTYYEKQKNCSNQIDFDDMLLNFYDLLNSSEKYLINIKINLSLYLLMRCRTLINYNMKL